MSNEQEPPIKKHRGNKFSSLFPSEKTEDIEKATHDLQALHAHLRELINLIPGDAHEFNLSHLNSSKDESADPASTG
jgi:hypothetical protein